MDNDVRYNVYEKFYARTFMFFFLLYASVYIHCETLFISLEHTCLTEDLHRK